jgi:dTMP kinase
MFVTIEGPDKAGKTTQIKLLKDYAAKNNLDWLFTRNPGGTDLGTELRNIVLDSKQSISDVAELMIYLADRAHHVATTLKPALAEKRTVICDRFTDSTIAYQGYGRGIDIKTIETMNNLVCDGVKADLTIMLMVSPQVALARAANSEADRLEKENKLFFIRVRNGYNVLAREHPTRIKVIDVDNLSPNQVHERVIALIKNKAETLHE